MIKHSLLDQTILNFHKVLETIAGTNTSSTRPNPANHLPEPNLSTKEQRHAAGLMRVNHVGEVCAQALYQGQALTAKDKAIQEKLQHAAQEEQDHLAWCQQRLKELNSRTSYLNPFWYTSSLLIGMIAGLAGDRYNLGFIAETEYQVEQHLTDHLQKLPAQDEKSRCIVEQMRTDESQHAAMANAQGAADLPSPIKFVMSCISKLMTTTAYWI